MTFPIPGGSTFLRARRNLADVASGPASAVNIGALQIAANLSDVASAAAALRNLGGQGLVAQTAVAGYTLINGTGTVPGLTWTAPNDGALHWFTVYALLYVSTANETGGQISVNFTAPNGQAGSEQLFAAGLAVGVRFPSSQPLVCQANTTVSVAQVTALTLGGPSTMWAGIVAL